MNTFLNWRETETISRIFPHFSNTRILIGCISFHDNNHYCIYTSDLISLSNCLLEFEAIIFITTFSYSCQVLLIQTHGQWTPLLSYYSWWAYISVEYLKGSVWNNFLMASQSYRFLNHSTFTITISLSLWVLWC